MKKINKLTQKRSKRKKVLLKSGAYLIVTDTEKTEKYYFEGIKNIIPTPAPEFRGAPHRAA